MTNTTNSSSVVPHRIQDAVKWDMETDVAIVGYGGSGAALGLRPPMPIDGLPPEIEQEEGN